MNDGTNQDSDERRFLERFAVVLSDSGYPRMAARVFSALLLSPNGKRTAAELVELLGVGPSAISGGINYLLRTGMAVRERDPGQRRDHYGVHQLAWFEALTSSDNVYRRFEDVAHEGTKIFGTRTEVGARLAQTERFFAFLREEIPQLMRKWRELDGT
ncbi:MarR family transcriptional regulator [Kibdelosporangium persicum]|uniref:DNA-binding transcriptional regulator GbsR, MarR family n=1 Tax=Kibdelosporangium persicum TaxID=2698649 RepID=A0ABX2FG29_9PSEU|nr:MarR family transcriptional regulator [Kibdelosporangium persicum]NRN70188.1 DNA-binding transcriptional regulator GbsR, MarR family [Kibdelosporangium persicum]